MRDHVANSRESHLIQYTIAYDLLQKPINQFIADRLPDWIITDLAAHWVVEAGKEYDVPLVYFSVFSAATRAFVSSAQNLSSGHTKGLSTVAFRGKEAGFYGVNDSGISDAERRATILSPCPVHAIRSCEEFEGEYLEAYKNNSGKLVIPTGLLPPEKPAKGVKREVYTDDGIFEWLDKQKNQVSCVCRDWE
ncbi:UDP-rhamnose:rhamnosyltransferase 1 [Pyrus ussuriensis x Pyrus communis]|uniref:UDP-rhamnose:rhamnosyltransferase 1 n=1 Tax=Pyrus ussuriensis x Pyrus communis TaxID=2448454 RepID=A0A5N5F3U1_9ROSA|nr:UDP-rhamnose:rhamnosyltransferase 1 [Pyrus ussuriensis x Pyrus communis]